jgi:hypothetical protein
MKTIEDLVIEMNACSEAKNWAKGKSIESIVKDCQRGDWLLWLSNKIGVDLRSITLAKALCAKTVIDLMRDQRSIDAVNMAEKFGMGLATIEELNDAAYDANTTSYAAAADTAYDAAYSAAYSAAKESNQLLTANICREIIGYKIIDLVNIKLK